MLQLQALSSVPVYEQIVDQTERLVLCGILTEGSAMPSVRSLSIQLSVNPNTIQKAYTELDARGVLCAVPGKGCFIASGARSRLTEMQRTQLPDLTRRIEEFALAGIPKEEIIFCVNKAYEEGSRHDSSDQRDHEI